MRRFACALFALVLLAGSARAQHGDAYFTEKLDSIRTAILGKSTAAVEKILGKPRHVDQEKTAGMWYYNFKIEPHDVTTIVGFSVYFRNDHVASVQSSTSYEPLMEIGKFAGIRGNKATQRDILFSFSSYRKPDSLSTEERLLILEAVFGRTGRAEEQKEPLILPADCPIAVLIIGIFEELSLPLPKVGEGNEQGLNLKEIKDHIERAIKELKAPRQKK